MTPEEIIGTIVPYTVVGESPLYSYGAMVLAINKARAGYLPIDNIKELRAAKEDIVNFTEEQKEQMLYFLRCHLKEKS